MSDSIKISVIIPVYNVEKYLEKCLRSVLSQTHANLEILCVDDGSTDKSDKILDDFAREDARIKVFHQYNKGLSCARNLALSNATGDFFVFVDGDDWIESDMIEKLLKNIFLYNADISICGFIKECIRGSQPFGEEKFMVLDTEEGLLELVQDKSFRSYMWNKLFRREIFNGISFPEGVVFEDYSIMHNLFMRAKRIVYDNKHLYHYLIREDSITFNKTLRSRIDFCLNAQARFEKVLEQYPNMYDKLLASYACRPLEEVMQAFEVCSEEEILDNAQIVTKEIIPFVGKYIHTIEKYIHFPVANLYIFMRGPYEYKLSGKSYRDKKKTASLTEMKELREQNVLWMPELIVSFTSYPARISIAHKVVEALNRQTLMPDKILLYLADSQFPDRKIPDSLSKLAANGSVIIKWVYDLKPHKKYYYAMQEYPEAIIITVDDDIYYDEDLVEKLYRSYLLYPQAISCLRSDVLSMYDEETFIPYSISRTGKRVVGIPSLTMLPTGVGGVLYPPHSLSESLFDIAAIERLCPLADDLWLKWMALKKGTPTILIAETCQLKFIEGTQEAGLWKINCADKGNDYSWYDIVKEDPGVGLSRAEILKSLYDEYCNVLLHEELDVDESMFGCALSVNNKNKKLPALLEIFKKYIINTKELDVQLKNKDAKIAELTKTVKEKDTKLADLTKNVKDKDAKVKSLSNADVALKNSLSFKIGRAITFVPRKIRGGIMCFKEHGIVYTIKRVLWHFRIR